MANILLARQIFKGWYWLCSFFWSKCRSVSGIYGPIFKQNRELRMKKWGTQNKTEESEDTNETVITDPIFSWSIRAQWLALFGRDLMTVGASSYWTWFCQSMVWYSSSNLLSATLLTRILCYSKLIINNFPVDELKAITGLRAD